MAVYNARFSRSNRHELARHAERLGLGAAGGDEVAGAGGVAGGVAVEEHRRPGAAGADDESGAEGNRTLDLLNAIQALSQLSYGPTG